MRAQPERDEQTVVIGMALGIFAVVLLSVALVGWALHSVSDVVDDHVEAIYGVAVLVAGIAAAGYLARASRP